MTRVLVRAVIVAVVLGLSVILVAECAGPSTMRPPPPRPTSGPAAILPDS